MTTPLPQQDYSPPPRVMLGGGYNQVALDKDQRKKWDSVLAYFGWQVQGMEYLMYKLLDNNPDPNSPNKGLLAIFTTDIKTACTDAKNIVINPDWFFQMTIKEGLFVLAHEVAHVMRGDVEQMHDCMTAKRVPQNDGTTLPADQDMINKAMDFAINAMLVEGNIGTMPQKGCLDMSKFKGDSSWLDNYGYLYKNKPKNPPPKPPGKPGEEGNDPGDGKGEGFDELLPPGKSLGADPDSKDAKRDKEQWRVEVQAAQEMERKQGNLKGAMQKMFKDILEPHIPWYEKLATLTSRNWGAGGYNWKIPDRRFIGRDVYLPSRSSKQAGWLVVWNDSSGSMSDQELQIANGNLIPIVEDCRPKRLTVIWADCQVIPECVFEIDDPMALKEMQLTVRPPRGGTSIHPVMDWIKDTMEAPDMFIGFTDGEFDFPRQPQFPVIWCSVRPHTYPYGDVITIDKKDLKRHTGV